MFTSNHSHFLPPVWLFQWSMWHFQVAAPIKPPLSSSISLIVWCPCCENYPHTRLFPMLEMFNFNCMSFFFFFPAIFPLFSLLFLHPPFSFRLSLVHSFTDKHLYCWWWLLELETCQKSCHGSKRMSQALSVIKPTVAKCTGRQWRFVDDHFFVHQFGAATCFRLVPFSSSCGSN